MYSLYEVTNKIFELVFKLILRYFTAWILILHFIYIIGLKNFQYSLLFLSIIVSIVGFIITYIYPKELKIPYLNLIIKGIHLKLFDLLCHQVPLILLLILYDKKIKNDNLIFALVIIVLYLLFNNPIKIYNLQ